MKRILLLIPLLLLSPVTCQTVVVSVFPQTIVQIPQDIYMTVRNDSSRTLTNLVIVFDDTENIVWVSDERQFNAPAEALLPSHQYTVTLGTCTALSTTPILLSGKAFYFVDGVLEEEELNFTISPQMKNKEEYREVIALPAIFLGAGVLGLFFLALALFAWKKRERTTEEETEAEEDESSGILYTDSTFDLYIHEEAFKKMLFNALEFAGRNLETMGFLVGDRFSFSGKEYTVVRDMVSGELDATPSSVKFERQGFKTLFEKLDTMGEYVLLGWYHSHPGYGCFMSSVDMQTQSEMFRERYHVAIVVDPVNRDFRVFRVEEGRLYEKSFKVFF